MVIFECRRCGCWETTLFDLVSHTKKEHGDVPEPFVYNIHTKKGLENSRIVYLKKRRRL